MRSLNALWGTPGLLTQVCRTRRFAYLALAGLLLLCGCGKKGPERHDISGTVTFRGKPVPMGSIMFNPELSKGNDGVQGFARIRNGRYDTREYAKGTSAGWTRIVIDGFEDNENDAGQPKSLFRNYQILVELPKESAEMNFDVPNGKKPADK